MGLDQDYLLKSARVLASRRDIPWGSFCAKKIVITGSTGLIGSQLVRTFLARNDHFHACNQLILPVRNINKAICMFGDRSDISFLEWNLDSAQLNIDSCDFFIHAACGTSSQEFLKNPVSTILSIVNGGKVTLQSAQDAGATKYLFLSTMEVYGEVSGLTTEVDLGCLDPTIVRNSYPEAKRLVECLCSSYCSEYELPTVILRLAQTFGQGVSFEDSRVFAEFGRHAVKGEDIILFSDGSKKNMYLSVDDAARAILFVLAYGSPGDAYNAANESTYCSIREMAELVIKKYGSKNATVRCEIDENRAATFRKSSDLYLDCSKLNEIGWIAKDSLDEMYRAMLNCWKTTQHSH